MADNGNGRHPNSRPNPNNARPGNRNTLKHGGDAALLRIQAGTELTGPARDAELAVYTELANEGRPSIVTRNAARLQAAADLFWSALVDAGERNDLQAVDRYVARFGWLSSAALRAWEQVRKEQAGADDGTIEAAYHSAKGTNGNDSSTH